MIVLMSVLLTYAALFGIGTLDLWRAYEWRHEAQVAADAGALAGSSALLEGVPEAAGARVAEYVAKNPVGDDVARIESLAITATTLRVVVVYTSHALLFAPHGVTVRAAAGSKVYRTNDTGVSGRPVPKGRALGWWRNEDKTGTPAAGPDSAGIALSE